MKQARHQITKEELQYLVDNAVLKSDEEIAEQLKISINTIKAMKGILRKMGVDIPRKDYKSTNREVITAFVEEWKLKNAKQ